MLDFIVTCLMIISAYRIGYIRGISPDKEMKIGHMNDLLNEAHEQKNHMKSLWIEAEDKAELWKRRYLNLAGQKVGS